LNVCYIYQDEYPWDVRAEKITTSLAAHGVNVHVLGSNTTGKPRYEKVTAKLHYHRLPAWWGARSRRLLNLAAFFSPVWIRETVALIRREQIDLLIVRDLPLGPMAWLAGRMTGARVIMDMAENYPAMIQDTWTFRGPAPLDYVMRNPAVLRALERWLLPRLDGVFVVSGASRDRVLSVTRHQRPVWVVGNTPRLVDADKSVPHPVVDAIRRRGALTLIYVGNLDAKRGVDVVLKALPLLREQLQDVLFVIGGRGGIEASLRDTARNLGVEENVIFSGWVDPTAVPSLIAAADIGVVAHYATEHTNTTIPNKIYDYMAQRKPVVVSTAKNLQDIVEQSGCGRVFLDRDHADFARAVLSLSDPEQRRIAGEAGRMAVDTEFNWDHDEKILVEAVASFA